MHPNTDTTPDDLDGISIAVERITAAYAPGPGHRLDQPPRTHDHFILRITGPGTGPFEAEFDDLGSIEALAMRIVTTARSAHVNYESVREAQVPAGLLVNEKFASDIGIEVFDPVEGWRGVWGVYIDDQDDENPDPRVRGLVGGVVRQDTQVFIRARTAHAEFWKWLGDAQESAALTEATRRLPIGHVLAEDHDATSCVQCSADAEARA